MYLKEDTILDFMTDFRMVKRLWNKGSRWIESNPIRDPIFQTKIFVNQPSSKNSKSQELVKVKSTRWVLLKIARFLGLMAIRLYIYSITILNSFQFNFKGIRCITVFFGIEFLWYCIWTIFLSSIQDMWLGEVWMLPHQLHSQLI